MPHSTTFVQDALDVANLFRDAIGIEKLDALPWENAIPSHATECVLALAFDHGCRVTYDAHQDITGYPRSDPDEYGERRPVEPFLHGGAVQFPNNDQGRRDAKVLANQLEVELIEDSGLSDYPYAVPLPDDVTRIARMFDDEEEGGREELRSLVNDLWPEAVPEHEKEGMVD
jgi:hypothetical protein